VSLALESTLESLLFLSAGPVGADALLRRNLLLYGLGGILLPFIGIKLIDLILVALHLTA